MNAVTPPPAAPAAAPALAVRRHCRRLRVIACRGLCDVCRKRPEVRRLYPTSRGTGRLGVGNGNCGYRLAVRPTAHPPGSPGKVEALEERARLGLSLWHPEDAR